MLKAALNRNSLCYYGVMLRAHCVSGLQRELSHMIHNSTVKVFYLKGKTRHTPYQNCLKQILVFKTTQINKEGYATHT